ncbi:maleylpyruvate isomerase N-terminal domain-containing protein [Phaeobacter inhibens]|jgi:maleylpyruvate isomerase|uniref:Mycothiol maleylpyruvate isomerase n=1 Tax=Phaeobacter inhibens TaxID=221822 RepID=A0A2I7KG65_9RHOB|nr:maleylpyruvate isomerase N-terminal domain-containing protein [Phaeobacter inhibens]AUR01583.1 Mycothiol maleylpyruvate isomerase [Phaeobacter inhibens]
MSSETDAARAALRQRQGKGARFDAASAPHDDLLLARRGTAFFARKLSELSDTDLYQPSAFQGRSRAWVVVDVSFAARRQALMLESLFRGRPTDLPPDLEHQFSDLDLAETLPPQAIRHLFRHSEVHLNVCWRDLSDTQWDLEFAMPNGSVGTPRLLPPLRAVQVWHAALGLGNGASARDLPVELED